MVASISECLNEIDNMIFNKSSNLFVKGDLEDKREHFEWKQADILVMEKTMMKKKC